MAWVVYILECENNKLYTGMTNDLAKRLKMHCAGKGGRFTRAFGVKRVVYQEACATRGQALRREAAIKRLTKNQKLLLIDS